MKKRVTTRMNKLRRKQIKYSLISLIKALLKNVYYLLIGIAYVILKVYVELEKGFIKLWKLLPIWVKRIIIIVMLININILNDKPAEIIEKIKTNTEIKEIYTIKEIAVEPQKCEWGIYECAIYDKALEYGLTEEQSKIAIAITKHETGSYTSSLFKSNNNIGGLYNGNAQKFYSYSSVEDGIDAYLNNLKKGYFDKGLDTIEKIQSKYAPINANNDPTGLNNNWVSGVTYFYNQL